MSIFTKRLLFWTPRILGVSFALFIPENLMDTRKGRSIVPGSSVPVFQIKGKLL